MKLGTKAVIERHIYRSVLVPESPNADWPGEMFFDQQTVGGKLENLAFVGTSGR